MDRELKETLDVNCYMQLLEFVQSNIQEHSTEQTLVKRYCYQFLYKGLVIYYAPFERSYKGYIALLTVLVIVITKSQFDQVYIKLNVKIGHDSLLAVRSTGPRSRSH